MSTDPKTGEQPENKHDSDGNTKHILQSSPPTKQAVQTSGDESGCSSSKKISKWKILQLIMRLTAGPLSKEPKPKERDATNTPPPSPIPSTPPSSPTPASSPSDQLIKCITADLSDISAEAENLQQYHNQLTKHHKNLESRFNEIRSYEEVEKEKALKEFRKKLMKVKLTIPSKYKNGEDKNLGLISEVERSNYGDDMSKKMPQLHRSPVFETSPEMRDFEARYMELDDRVKLCLLCFSIFPQDAVIKKRLMLQWWVVEGFAPKKDDAAHHFKELMEKGFIHPVNDNRSPSIGSCRVHPFHRSALVALAKRARLFNFSGRGDPTQSFSGCFQACLMGAGLISYEDFQEKYKSKTGEEPTKVINDSKTGEEPRKVINDSKKGEEPRKVINDSKTGEEPRKVINDSKKGEEPRKVINELIQELEKLHLLMNVDEHILEFIDEWFSKLENLNFLYLGRWKASATHHIEVEDPKFLEKLWNMKYLKFLSLQGVSNIISLPRFKQKLTNLDVLDLRACSNLESIPENIGHYLQMLTHLDMSECYLLAHMPKTLSLLKNLKVLKGFVVPKSKDLPESTICTLGDLKKWKQLEKLCIYTELEEFPEEEHVVNLKELTSLAKLTITWGVSHKKSDESDKKSEESDKKSEKKDSPKKSAESNKKSEKKDSPKKSAESNKKSEEKEQPSASAGGLPPNLEKLDLKCFPTSTTPYWLEKLKENKELKKLYIRGGRLTDLGQYQRIDGEKWTVEELRLKYLSNIKMEWRQLQELFPKLEYLEKVSCPNLNLFPCDAKGVWIKPH